MELFLNINNYELDRKCGLHILSPYVGKIRPQLANYIISEYSNLNSLIVDPFCGSGTVALEGWLANRNVLANDLNPYAVCITKGKLFPYKNLESAQSSMNKFSKVVDLHLRNTSLKEIPEWVKAFYHEQTLKEIILWISLLKEKNDCFLLSNLLGILHHQRPGFLSFPSSHGAPYLRDKKYPRSEFPEMYEYRNVHERLQAKVKRSFENFPDFDFSIKRKVINRCASSAMNKIAQSTTIITSPPYMKSLTYARDNRLRLWFLGTFDWQNVDRMVSPSKNVFKELMAKSIPKWFVHQKKGDYCIIIIGDLMIDKTTTATNFITSIAEKSGYILKDILSDPIPDIKRMVKKESQIKSEEIIVLKREN
jgi:hypothetical protein